MAQAVPGGEANRAKMGDVYAGHALQGLMDPTVSWGTLGAHLAAAKGARGARVGGGVNEVTRKQTQELKVPLLGSPV